MPGALMAMFAIKPTPQYLFMEEPLHPVVTKTKKLDVVSAFEAWGEKVAGTMEENEFKQVVRNACPGAGACGGMYTANTMASAIEALGMALPYNSSNPAISKDKKVECEKVGSALKHLIENDIKPLDIVTKKIIGECNSFGSCF